MANNPNAKANLKPAKKGEVRNPNGRPKNIVSATLDALKEKGYEPISPSQIKQTYEMMITLPRDDLTRIGADEKQGMLFRILAKGILSGKGFEIIEKMLDRAQGRPSQSMTVDSHITGDVVFVNDLPRPKKIKEEK